MTLQEYAAIINKIGPYSHAPSQDDALGLQLLIGSVQSHSSANPIKVKGVQTFWSAAHSTNKLSIHDKNNTLGWGQRHHALCAWVLSAGLLSRICPTLRLLTDKEGCTLAAQLGLPYTEISTSLDRLEKSFPLNASYVANLYAMSIQNEPCLLVDRSVFMLEPVNHPDVDFHSTLYQSAVSLWRTENLLKVEHAYANSIVDLLSKVPAAPAWKALSLITDVPNAPRTGFFYGALPLAEAARDVLTWLSANLVQFKTLQHNQDLALLFALAMALKQRNVQHRPAFSGLCLLRSAYNGYVAFQGNSVQNTTQCEFMVELTRRLFPLQYEACLRHS